MPRRRLVSRAFEMGATSSRVPFCQPRGYAEVEHQPAPLCNSEVLPIVMTKKQGALRQAGTHLGVPFPKPAERAFVAMIRSGSLNVDSWVSRNRIAIHWAAYQS